jgi:hypothetical protein
MHNAKVPMHAKLKHLSAIMISVLIHPQPSCIQEGSFVFFDFLEDFEVEGFAPSSLHQYFNIIVTPVL